MVSGSFLVERMILVDPCASLVGPEAAALHVACAQEMEGCGEASGEAGGSSAQVNVAPEGACVGTSGPFAQAGDRAADAALVAHVEVGREEERMQDPVEGSLCVGSDLVVHWGVLGRTGAHHWRVKAEEGPSLPGGLSWVLRERKRDEISCIWNQAHSKEETKRGLF